MIYTINGVPYDSDFLAHHGIIGQQWGVRNGPPYPLYYRAHPRKTRQLNYRRNSIHSPSESHRRAHKVPANTANVNIQKTSSKHDEGNSPKQKENSKLSEFIHSKQFKILVGVTALAVTGYVAYRIGKKYIDARDVIEISDDWGVDLTAAKYDIADKVLDVDRSDPLRDIMKQRVGNTLANMVHRGGNLDSLSKAARSTVDYYNDFFSGKESAAEKLVGGVNHGFTNFVDPDRSMNCGLCASSIIARLKGFEVSAGLNRIGMMEENLEECFEGSEFKKFTATTVDSLHDFLKGQGDGHYGELFLTGNHGGRHIVAYAVRNGSVDILEGQVEKVMSLKDYLETMYPCDISRTTFADLTNCSLTEKAARMFSSGLDTFYPEIFKAG